jgi:hypothetical protein
MVDHRHQEMVPVSMQLSTSIDIDADPGHVWQVLTDLARYRDWNPFITHAEGPVAVGQRLTLRMQPVGGRKVTIRPTVLEATPGRQLRWLGRLGVAGLFDGEHVFTITSRPDGGVRLTQEEQFRGLLVPLLARVLTTRTRPAFEAMNEALKHRAEQRPAAQPG